MSPPVDRLVHLTIPTSSPKDCDRQCVIYRFKEISFIAVFEACAVRLAVADPDFDRVGIAHHVAIAQTHVHPALANRRLNFAIAFVQIGCAVGIAGRLVLLSDGDNRRMAFPGSVVITIKCLAVPDSRHCSDHACPLFSMLCPGGDGSLC